MLLSTSTFLMVRKERLISLFLDGYNWMEQQPISALSINSILLNLVRDTVIDFCTAQAVGDLNPDHVGEVGEGYRPRSNDVGGEATHGWQGRAGQAAFASTQATPCDLGASWVSHPTPCAHVPPPSFGDHPLEHGPGFWIVPAEPNKLALPRAYITISIFPRARNT